jgi:hypothetical protein
MSMQQAAASAAASAWRGAAVTQLACTVQQVCDIIIIIIIRCDVLTV